MEARNLFIAKRFSYYAFDKICNSWRLTFKDPITHWYLTKDKYERKNQNTEAKVFHVCVPVNKVKRIVCVIGLYSCITIYVPV